MQKHRITHDVTALSDAVEIPGLGVLPVNTFVLQAAQPLVVDAGLGTPDKDYVNDLSKVMDPVDVRWIWLTHPDRDHTGGLFALLEAAPRAKVVTTFAGVGILSCERQLPLDRVHFINPGDELDLGDRRLLGLRPPLFDNPATVAAFDRSTGVLFSSDCFGAPLASAELATCGDARAVDPEALRQGQLLWAIVDSPWVHLVDTVKFRASLEHVRALAPSAVLSTHLPPAFDITDVLLENAASAPDVAPFVGPDQAALEAMLASFQPAGD
jgi:hypothetical protein